MDFKFPDVGEGITEGKLVRWHVKEGDMIKSEQTVASVETDKAVVDIPSPMSGMVEHLYYKAGDTVYVGRSLMSINDGKTTFVSDMHPSMVSVPRPVEIKKPAIEKTVEVKQPEQIYEPVRQESYRVEQTNQNTQTETRSSYNNSQVLAMPQVRHESKARNIDLTHVHASGAHGQILMNDIEGKTGSSRVVDSRPRFESQTNFASSRSAVQTNQPVQCTPVKSFSEILATPSTRQLARTRGVDLTQVKGTGTNGMVLREDVLNYGKQPAVQQISPQVQSYQAPVQQQQTSYQQPIVSSPIPTPTPQTISGTIERVPMSGMRQAISKHMTESNNNIPPFTVMDEVDVTELVKTREKLKEQYEKQGIKLTYLPFITKAVVLALKKHPFLNANINDGTKEFILKHYYNIGIATDTSEGLIVPVIKDSEYKNIIALAQIISDMASRARERKLKIDEMNDGTFTITSLGNSFGQGFTPIINYPETAILGVGRIVEKPVVFNGQIIARKMVTLSLTCDHRLIDGAEASRFMNDVKIYLEDLNVLLLELT